MEPGDNSPTLGGGPVAWEFVARHKKTKFMMPADRAAMLARIEADMREVQAARVRIDAISRSIVERPQQGWMSQ